MRVHILGVVSLNGGDSAILSGQVAVIRSRWPEADIHVSEADPTSAKRYLPDLQAHPFLLADTAGDATGGRKAAWLGRVRRTHLLAVADLFGRGASRTAHVLSSARQRELLDPLITADLVAYTGGTSLSENYDLRAKLFDLEVVRRLRKPLVFLPQSAGPFHQPRNRSMLQRIFRSSAAVILRDERSLRHVLDVGAPPDRCSVEPDMCFAIAEDPDGWRTRQSISGRPRVVVSVREWAHFNDFGPEEGMRRYVSAIRAAVTGIVRESDAEVVFLSTCQGRPEYWLDDSALAVTIAEGLDPDIRPHVTVDREARSPEALKVELAHFDAMLSTRMHGGVLAACVGVPALTIAYEYKTREVWRQLGLEAWVLDIESTTADVLPQALTDLLLNRQEVVEQLAKVIPQMRDEALSVSERLANAATEASRR
jgi:colanic acid/amylovoran biosynthesis protein